MERETIDGTVYEFDVADVMGKSEMEEMFQESMDDCLGEVEILGYTFSQADALKQLDPIAYRQEFLNWLDSMMSDGEIVELTCGFIFKEALDAVDEDETEEEGE